MILRKCDWNYYPDAIIHYSTKNESFLRLAYVMRMQGVEHWYCCLALLDPELENVDPLDPDLTVEQKTRVVREMFRNPWYFFREVIKIPQDGADPVPFKIHRGSFALIWTFFNNIDIALLLIRQQGKTIVIAALLTYLLRILKNSRTILITRGSDLRTETISKIKQMRDTLPGYCWEHDKGDLDNTEVVTYVKRNNRLLTAIAQNSKESALNSGRGLTCARLISDETAFTKFVRIMLPAALAAGTTARRIAEEEGVPYGNIFTTTPGKRDEEDGKFVYDMFYGGMYWDEHFLDIPTRDQLIDVINKGSKGDRTLIHAPFTHRQLGLTDIDLYKAMANAGGTPEEQLRDFGLRWTAGSLQSPFTVEESEMVSKSVINPLHVEIFPNNYALYWYYDRDSIPKKLETKHIAGLDTSDAVGRDNISMVIINSETMETAATAVVNESNLIVFTNWVADILTKYENTILVIERKSSAPTCIDSLLITLPSRGIEPSRRIFNRIVQDGDSTSTDYKEFRKSSRPRDERFYEIYRKYFGFNTSGTTRKLLYGEVLQNAVRMAGDKIRDRGLAAELLALVVRDGRIDHKLSGHDDRVISWLLACWFILFGRNLDYYGINSKILLKRTSATARGEVFDEEEFLRDEEEQRILSDQIDEICTKIANTRNIYLRQTLERQLKMKLSNFHLDTTEASSISELQDLIRSERKLSRYS